MAHPTPATNPAFLSKRGRRGFTLAECLIASVVLSFTVLGICGAMSAATGQSNAMEVEAHCLSMARDLMEQTASRSFDVPASNDHPGWSTGNRQVAHFDNIADFNGMLQYFDPVDPATRITDTIEISRAVSVQFRATPGGAANAAGNFAMITVTITPSAYAGPVTLRRLVARTTIVRE